MKFLAMVQARIGSTRLPGKILMDLAGKPVLQRVLERAAKSNCVDEVVAVTSFAQADIPTLHLVSGLGYRAMAGSEDDVLDRFYQCAKLIEPEYIVRITGDCPLYDAALLDMAIGQLRPETDYMASLDERIADGLDIEIFRYTALKESWEQAKLMSEREHVTLYIKNHPEKYTLQNFNCPYGDLNKERWSLDEPEDYQLLKTIYEHFGHDNFTTRDVLDYLDAHPRLREINSFFGRNEGLEKSLAQDKEVHS